jgi:hypothetical protein
MIDGLYPGGSCSTAGGDFSILLLGAFLAALNIQIAS